MHREGVAEEAAPGGGRGGEGGGGGFTAKCLCPEIIVRTFWGRAMDKYKPILFLLLLPVGSIFY